MRYEKIVYWLSCPLVSVNDLIETDLTLDEIMFISNDRDKNDPEYIKAKQEIFYELSN